MKILLNLFKIGIIGLTLLNCSAQAENKPVSSIDTGIINVNDTGIEYFSQGSGDVIILLSGRGLDVGYLEGLASTLSHNGYRAVRINRRGAGKSTGALYNINYHTHATDVANIMKALHIEKATILGHALGGRIARVIASDYPKLTTSVILMPASGKVSGDPREAKAMGKLFAPNAPEDDIMNGMKLMVGNPADSQRVWDIIKVSSLSSRPLTMKSEVTSKSPLEEWWAPKGTTPYLAIQGLKDKSVPPQNAQLLKEEIGDRLTIVELPEAGHLAPVEYPTEVASAIISFLK